MLCGLQQQFSFFSHPVICSKVGNLSCSYLMSELFARGPASAWPRSLRYSRGQGALFSSQNRSKSSASADGSTAKLACRKPRHTPEVERPLNAFCRNASLASVGVHRATARERNSTADMFCQVTKTARDRWGLETTIEAQPRSQAIRVCGKWPLNYHAL